MRERSRALRHAARVAAAFTAAFAIYAALLYALYGVHPIEILTSLGGVLATSKSLERSIVRSLPVAFSALGLVVAFKMGYWNIGAEGQLLVGMLVGTACAVTLSNEVDSRALALISLAAAAASGGLWALLPAYLRARLEVNEVLSTLMMNYVAAAIFDYIVRGPLRDPRAYGFIRSPPIPAQARLEISDALLVCVALSALVLVLLELTKYGYEVKVVGASRTVAEASGIDHRSLLAWMATLSGALAGLGGFVAASTMLGVLMESSRVSPGYGYTAIIAAWLANLHPALVLPASLLLGVIYEAGAYIEILHKVPVATTMVFQGVLLLALAVPGLPKRRTSGR